MITFWIIIIGGIMCFLFVWNNENLVLETLSKSLFTINHSLTFISSLFISGYSYHLCNSGQYIQGLGIPVYTY